MYLNSSLYISYLVAFLGCISLFSDPVGLSVGIEDLVAVEVDVFVLDVVLDERAFGYFKPILVFVGGVVLNLVSLSSYSTPTDFQVYLLPFLLEFTIYHSRKIDLVQILIKIHILYVLFRKVHLQGPHQIVNQRHV